MLLVFTISNYYYIVQHNLLKSVFMKIFKIIIVTLISTLATTSLASENQKPEDTKLSQENEATVTQPSITNSGKLKEPKEFQKVIDEYKEYVSKIPAEVREEIITYRKEIAKINRQKRLLYSQLSDAGQEYLKTEQEYKKRLPLNKKSLIKIDK